MPVPAVSVSVSIAYTRALRALCVCMMHELRTHENRGQTLVFSCAFISTPIAMPMITCTMITCTRATPYCANVPSVYATDPHCSPCLCLCLCVVFVFAFAFVFVFVFAFASLCVCVYISLPLHRFSYIFSCLSVPITLYLSLCLFRFRVPVHAIIYLNTHTYCIYNDIPALCGVYM